MVRRAYQTRKIEEIFDHNNEVNFIVNNDEGYGGFDDQASVVIQVPKSRPYANAKHTGTEVMLAGGIVIVVFLLGSVFFARALMGPLSQTAIAIVENVTDGLILIDSNDKIERFNPSCEQIFGYRASKVIGKPTTILMSAGMAERHNGSLSRYIRGEGCGFVGNTVEVEGKTKDGRLIPIELSVNALNLNGRIKFSGVTRDISEQREVERVKTEFVSTVSHELRTPLTSIRGLLGLVGKMIPNRLPSSLYQMISLAQKNTDRLIVLVNDILDFEKLTSQKVSYDLETVEVAGEIALAAELISGYADQFSVTVKTEEPETRQHVYVDVSRFQKIMANLLSNAVKFSPTDGTVILRRRRRTGAYAFPSRIIASAFPWNSRSTSSPRSSRPTAPRPARSAEQGSACRLPRSSSKAWAGKSGSTAKRGKARPSGSHCPQQKPLRPAARSSARARIPAFSACTLKTIRISQTSWPKPSRTPSCCTMPPI
ncbi:PAS domain S-box protein [Breoghania sp.]|uniref:sensor histidine kinase n=1 Tax=Breoghania sp. TaxID=2065378 RepID=UPI0026273BBF|nr:PAS domain S-box protein [Breoghania sp.]MDJ0932815.1 PAS domain S-box protein [Breoghania sp.]